MKINKVIMAVTQLGLISVLFVVIGLINDTQEAVANENPTQQIASFPDYTIGLFSHKAHVASAGLQCSDCHPKIFQMSASSAKTSGDFNKISFREEKYCGACHNGSKAFTTQDEANCKRCHGNDVNPPDTILLEKPVKVLFDHSLHNKELSLACDECHMKLFDMKVGSTGEKGNFTMKAMYDGKYCGACHNGSLAFDLKGDCSKCHADTPEYKRAISGTEEKEGAE